MVVQGKLLSFGEDLSEAFAIRRKVFVQELNIPEEIEFDNLDSEAMHAIVYEVGTGNTAVATGRIIYDGRCCLIDRVAVLEEFRGKKYGDFAVRLLLGKAFSSGIEEVLVKSPVFSVKFFETIGFQSIGEEFIYDDIPYHKMIINSINTVTLCSKKEK